MTVRSSTLHFNISNLCSCENKSRFESVSRPQPLTVYPVTATPYDIRLYNCFVSRGWLDGSRTCPHSVWDSWRRENTRLRHCLNQMQRAETNSESSLERKRPICLVLTRLWRSTHG